MGESIISRIGRNGSVNIVQETGTSTTDVMSQNACTDSFALLSHIHSADDITSGILPIELGGTGSDDFWEVGSWTPTIGSSGSTAPTVTYSYQYGTYCRIGRLVFFSCHICASITDAGSNYAVIKGLPYTCSAGCDKYGASLIEAYNIESSGSNDPRGYVSSNSTSIYVRGHSGAVATTWSTGSGQYIGYTGCYTKTA